MAVEDKYVETRTAAGKLPKSIYSVGSEVIAAVATFEIAAADDDLSVYRLFKGIPSNYIPVEITIATDGVTGATDADLGLYKVGIGGAVVDKDVLMDGQTLASALTRASGHQIGLANVNIADIGKTLGELSAQTDIDPSYDIAMTINTIGNATGTVTVVALFAQG